jgi:hypothetical protein
MGWHTITDILGRGFMMANRIRCLAAVVVAGLVAAVALNSIASTAYAADGCTYNSPYTPINPVYTWGGRKIELRANTSQVCAWGRITSAGVGDLVWVDRSYDGGRTWQQLGITQVAWGNSVYTPAYNDVGRVMRACAKTIVDPDVVCTGWW